MVEPNWEQFDDMFGLKCEAQRFDEVKSFSRNYAVIEITINLPKTAKIDKMSYQELRELYSERFIDLVNEVHRITGTVTQTKFIFEYGGSRGKMHLHGFIEYIHEGSYYGLLEQIYKYSLTKVSPGRGRENTWDRTRFYPFPCLSCPYICINIGPKLNSNGWTEYMEKNALKI